MKSLVSEQGELSRRLLGWGCVEASRSTRVFQGLEKSNRQRIRARKFKVGSTPCSYRSGNVDAFDNCRSYLLKPKFVPDLF